MEQILKNFLNESLSNQWSPSWPLPKDVYKSDWPWVPVDFDADFGAMLDECKSNDHLFVGHRQKDRHQSYNHEGWAAVTLHGSSPTATESWEQYGFDSLEEADYHWTELCELFPTCVKFLKSLKYDRYDRVRIMKLAPGGYIMPHVDGPGRCFGALNVAINNPTGCDFYFRKWGRVPFEQGRGFFLDIANEHIVWNNSNEPRYHFIVHGSQGKHIQQYVYTQFKETYCKRSIAFGVYNQRDKINNLEMYQIAKGSTLFYLERLSQVFGHDPLPIFNDDTIHGLLQQSLDAGVNYCVICAAGLQVRDFNFIKNLNEFIDTTDFGVAGHPLWKTDGRWLELHHQFFIVNIDAWNKIGRPEFGIWHRPELNLPVVERSIENFHDDYTPLWIKPTGEHAMQPGAGQGWKLISTMMDNGYTVSALPENIRFGKFYTYPDHETEQFLTSIKTLTPYENQNWNQNKWIEDSKGVKDQIWLWNSEDMRIRNEGQFDIIVNTASGFKVFDIFKENKITEHGKIIIYDFNPLSIEWFRHLHQWATEDLIECIRAFSHRDNFVWIDKFETGYQETWAFQQGYQEVLKYYGAEQFISYWNQFKNTRVEFEQIDLFNNSSKLAELLQGHGKKFVNLTNIFSTDASQIIFGHVECIAAQQRCLANLYVTDPDIQVTLFDFWNRHKFGAVKDIL